MILGSTLLGFALLVNLGNKKMLALTFFVAAGFLVDIPRTSADEFYLYCMLVETCIFIAALNVKCEASGAVMLSAGLLFLCHCLGYWKDGYPALSPYRALVPALEYIQIVCCIIFSRPLVAILHNRESQTK